MSEGFHHFKFLYQRFMTSTMGWKEEEQGAYLRLLIVQFDQGGIPSDIDAIGAISPIAKKIWNKKLKNKFKFTNEDGTLYNHIMKGIRDEALEKQVVNKENGGKGGRPKKNPTVILKKPNGFENNNPNGSETKPIPVTSNQEPKNTVVEIVNPWYEMFRRVAGSHINNNDLLGEIAKFVNRYPNAHPNQSGALVNTWVSNIGRVKAEIPKSDEKRMVV